MTEQNKLIHLSNAHNLNKSLELLEVLLEDEILTKKDVILYLIKTIKEKVNNTNEHLLFNLEFKREGNE